MSSTIERSVEVDVPVHVAYNQWTQFEDFPKFMEGIESVTQTDTNHTHWKAHVGFKHKEWDAEIIEQSPDHRISWRNTTGAPNAGVVTFLPLDHHRTKVSALITYHPETFVEQVGDFLGLVGHRVHGDLTRFKEFIETRKKETGGWRGEIHNAKLETDGGNNPSTSSTL